MAILPATVLAADCEPVADYRVGYVAYKARPLEQSLQRMLRGSPYKAIVDGGAPAAQRTKRLAGPLSRTFDSLASQFELQWQQEGCLVRFSAKAPRASTSPANSRVTITPASPVAEVRIQDSSSQSAVTAWALQAGRPIHLQFADWARTAGWTFEWRLEKSWIVPAAAQFSGSFDDALAHAVEALHAQGKPVRLILWDGNRFAEIVDVDAK
ncbi:toxin co-regulated pilus biosynthesis Q family protein [Janthinobacterium sp. 17J80-10]|uniref:toxin co-regulated pilus biosynthesis Q family protein n=1 Tax=Janthinobacterium sp. 17J80-10 TaxID=2497863 RepID=UPI0013E8BDB1|nr:toxin co-regulated pilus biosynthesis Q family protein [Janthinobacterium sp. 17J80-10]